MYTPSVIPSINCIIEGIPSWFKSHKPEFYQVKERLVFSTCLLCPIPIPTPPGNEIMIIINFVAIAPVPIN